MKNTLNIEKAILGSILQQNELIADAQTIIKPEHFIERTEEGKTHEYIYNLFLKEISGGGKVDTIFLTTYHDFSDYEAISLVSSGASTRNLREYCGALRKAHEKRQLNNLPNLIQDINNSDLSLSDRKTAVFTAVMDSLTDTSDTNGELTHINDSLKETLNAIIEQQNRGSDMIGLETSLRDVNERTGGLVDGNMIVIAGRPGHGKTALALNWADHAAMAGKHVVFYSLEMMKTELNNRSLAAIGRVNIGNILKADLEDREWGCITHAMNKLKDTKYFIKDLASASMASIESDLNRHTMKHGEPDLIVVDYLQLMEGGQDFEGVTAISRWTKLTAKRFNCPFIMLSQLSRDVEKRNDKRPMNSDLRQSGAIEQDANAIFFVYRDIVYNENSPYRDIAEIIAGKGRAFRPGTDYAKFEGRFQKFDNLDDSELNLIENIKNGAIEASQKKFKNRFE